MVTWRIVYTKQAIKDAKKIKKAGLEENTKNLLKTLEKNPFCYPPRYEKLVGDLDGAFSRRINIQHRLVYQVYKSSRTIKILKLWTHYE